MNEPLEDRIRAALRARAAATTVAPPPVFAPPRPARPSWVVPVGVATVGAAAAAVAVLAMGADGTDEPTVVAGPDAPASPETTAGSTAAEPLLGPLPYLLLDAAASPTSVEATTGASTAPPEPGWHVQVFESPAGAGGPRVQVLTLPYLDEDGPDDIGSTYAAAATDPVSVQGQPARLLRSDDGFVGLWWPGGGAGGVLLSAEDLSVEELLAMADGLVPRTDAGGWDVTSVPAGLAATVDAARGSDVADPWWNVTIQYEGTDRVGPALSVSTGGAVTFADMTAPSAFATTEPITVAGRPGILVTTGGDPLDHHVVWRPNDTTIAEIWAMGSTRDEVLALAAGVREVSEAVWSAALPPDTLTPAGQAALVAAIEGGSPLPAGGTTWADVLHRDSGSAPAADSVLAPRGEYTHRLFLFAACAWQLGWADATAGGDAAAAAAALDQLDAAGDWRITQVMIEDMVARGMPEADAESFLGWSRSAIENGDHQTARAEIESSCR